MISDLACSAAQLFPEDNLMVIQLGSWKNGVFTESGNSSQFWKIVFSEEDIQSEHLKAFNTPLPVYTLVHSKDYLVISFSLVNATSSEEIACMGFSFNNATLLDTSVYSNLTQHVMKALIYQDPD